MYWLNSPLLLQKGQTVEITCTVRDRLMDFQVSSLGSTCMAGSVIARTLKSLNSVPSAVLGLDTIMGDSHVALSSMKRHDTDGLIDAIWCPEYTVLRCNDLGWRRAILSDLVYGTGISILCLGDPLALAPLFYRAEGAHVVVDYADLEEDSEATFDALWEHLHSRPLQDLQHMQFLCDSPPGIVFDLIFWDPVEPAGLLRSGCFEELIASRTKHSRRDCIVAPCSLVLWAQGVTGAMLNDMTEVKGSEACGFDLSFINKFSVMMLCLDLPHYGLLMCFDFRCELYRKLIRCSFLPTVARGRSKFQQLMLAALTFCSLSSQ